MRGVMASNSSRMHIVQAPSRTAPRDRSPDAPVGRSGCCTGFLCLGSLKRGKRIVPATRMHDANNQSPRPWASNGGAQQSGSSANQYATLSPSLQAPPSSPASFQNSAVQSSAQSPCSFPVVSLPSATSQIPLERAQTMFQMGPYAHETALVSPPVFSNFTTAPSTAPFTPPPELATHLTTPSSPDVPFAQLLANSFGQKQAVRLQPTPTYSASPFASPDIFSADDLQAAYQLYPGSPLAHLLSPASGTGASTPFPELEVPTPVQAVASMFFPGSPLAKPDPPSMMELELANSSAFQQELQQQEGEQPTATTFFVLDESSGGDPSGSNEAECAERLVVDGNKGSDGSQTPKHAGLLESSNPEKDSLEEEQSASSAGESISKPESDAGISPAKLDLPDDISTTQHEHSKQESSDQIDRNPARFSNGATSPVTRLSSGGTSPVTYHQRLSNGGTYTDCVRLQHVTVAASEGYFDVFSSQQFTFAGQKFVAEPNCSKEKVRDFSSREKPECERGVLKVLLHHRMEKPVGVEGMDRVAIYREQQLNVPVNWIQSGAKLHQRSVDSVSRELPELGGTCSGSQTGPSTQLGMNLVEELK